VGAMAPCPPGGKGPAKKEDKEALRRRGNLAPDSFYLP